MSAINARAVSLIRYGTGIINWSKEELRNLDRKTRKLLSVYKSLDPQADVVRLYVKRSQGGRGLLSVEDCVNIEVGSLCRYVETSKEKLLIAIKNENILDKGKKKEGIRQERINSYSGKVLHGQFVRGTENRDLESWNWSKRRTMRKETVGLLTAAQDQALRTNYIKNKIDKLDVSPMCRMCGERKETISYITAECKKLARNQYKNWKHDKVAQVIDWNLCKKFDLPCKET